MTTNSHNSIVRMGIIGLGNIAKQHIANITSHAVSHCQISALCSRSDSDLSQQLNAKHFSDYRKLIDSGLVDAVLIATPTYSHFDIAEYALRKNIHVILEKPIALSSFQGEKLIQARGENCKFALMLNQRTDPIYIKIKQIVDSGVLGDIQRTHWTMSNWFRPNIYYQVSDWRATWKGEGGGLLVNQCIHNLDIFQWICGLPKQVQAFCEFGKYHDIEVEDEVSAFLRYENNATGIFMASTGEAPGVNRLDIIGDKGSLHFDGDKLRQTMNSQSTALFSRTTDSMFGTPETTSQNIVVDKKVNQHAIIMNNFVAAILQNEPLMVPGELGLASLDLASAMLLSTWQQKPIDFPLDRAYFQSKLDEKIAASSLRKKSNQRAKIDMSQSYR